VLNTIFSVVTVILGASAILALVVIHFRPDTAREEEEAAREFLDAHGHWPDEPPPARPIDG
jgi:hypothetical protein